MASEKSNQQGSAQRPGGMSGMRHVALFVEAFEACEDFYCNKVGMQVEWRPDEDNLYLCSGNDNVALHRRHNTIDEQGQRLDHIGFIIDTTEQVDEWFAHLKSHGIEMKTEPRTHRDGARSFYCFDPDGTTVQFIYHPPIVTPKS